MITVGRLSSLSKRSHRMEPCGGQLMKAPVVTIGFLLPNRAADRDKAP